MSGDQSPNPKDDLNSNSILRVRSGEESRLGRPTPFVWLVPIVVAVTFLGSLWVGFAPARQGLPNLINVGADTTLVKDWTTYTKSSNGTGWFLIEDDFEADTVVGKRYVLQIANKASPFHVQAAKILAGNDYWVGESEFGAPGETLVRAFDVTSTGTNDLHVFIYGPKNVSMKIRILRFNEPKYTIFGDTILVRPSPPATQTVYFSRTDTTLTPYTLRVMNGILGDFRVADATVKINGTDILGNADFDSGVAVMSKDVSLNLVDTLLVNNQGATSSRMVIRVTATDSTPPHIGLSQPAGDTIYTAGSSVIFAGTTTDQTPGWLQTNSRPLKPTPGSFADTIATTTDGRYPVTIQATNSAKLTRTVTRVIVRDASTPFIKTLRPIADTSVVAAADSFTLAGYFADTSTTILTVDADTVTKGWGDRVGFTTLYRLDPGMNIVTLRAVDRLGHQAELRRLIYRQIASESVIDSVVAATPSTSTGFGSFRDAIMFLFTGGSPRQTGVVASDILDPVASVLRGKVTGRDFTALQGVQVSVLGHPEFGSTPTRQDGRYDLAVNGGRQLTLRFTKAGYLESQRQVRPDVNDYAIVDNVAMVGKTARFTVTNLDSGGVVRSRLATDTNGDRELRLFFKPGTVARVFWGATDSASFTAVRVRATEYTIGGDGAAAMPAGLPPGSAYTYCVDLSTDECDSVAVAVSASALETRFTKPVVRYLRNFLHAPVGASIPNGFYESRSGVWKADSDGVVIRIAGVVGDTALVDANGSSGADNGAILDSLGFDRTELKQLASSYTVGDTLWRSVTRHFSSADANPKQGPQQAPLATGQGKASPVSPLLPCPTPATGSIIECESCVLGETVPITGTPFALNYRSFRAPGYAAARTVQIPLLGDSVPSGLRKVIVRMDVAGKRYETIETSLFAHKVVTLVWDGNDAYGRRVEQSANAHFTVGYDYAPVYALSTGGRTFGNGAASNGATLSAIGNRDQGRVAWSRRTISIGVPGTATDGLGGWTISPHHFYDVKGDGALYLGTGAVVPGSRRPAILSTVATGVLKPNDIAIGPDSTMYIADEHTHSIYKLPPRSATPTRIAGMGSAGDYEDGKKGTETYLRSPKRLALGPDGSVYFVMDTDDDPSVRACRLAPDDTIRSIAGTTTSGFFGDGGLATQAKLARPHSIALGPDGSVFVGDGGSSPYLTRIRRIAPDGIISTYAGSGNGAGSDSVGPATSLGLSGADDLAVDVDGTLYVACAAPSGSGARIKKVAPDGTMSTLVIGGAGYFAPFGIALGLDGALYIASGAGAGSGGEASKRLLRRDPDGTLVDITGIPPKAGVSGDYATASGFYDAGGMDVGPDGAVYAIKVYGTGSGEVWPVIRYGHLKSPDGASEIAVPSPDGSEVYYFTKQGIHLRTRDALTGVIRYAFNYDADNRLISIYDVDGDSTRISRSGAAPTAILGPFGQPTALTMDGAYLAKIEDPQGNAILLDAGEDGLLSSFIDAKLQQHTFTYFEDGRLETDSDPAGGEQTLTQEPGPNKRTITRTTVLNRETTYEVTDLYDGALQRRLTDPVGLITVVSDSSDGQSRLWMPVGMSVVDSVSQSGIPAFGVLAPGLRRTTQRTAGGLTRYLDVSETADTTFGHESPTGVWSRQEKINFRTPFTTTLTIAGSPATRRLVSVSPLNVRDSVVVDAAGRPLSVTASGLATVSYGYDAHGRVTHVVQDGRAWRYSYDANGLLASITDTLRRSTVFGYDDADRLTSQTLPDSQVIAYAYDPNGNLTSLTPPSGNAHTFDYSPVDQTSVYTAPDLGTYNTTQYYYNDDHQLVSVERPGFNTVDLAYNSTSGRLESVTIPRGEIELEYAFANQSGAGLVSGITSPDSVMLAYTYDGPLQLTETWSGRVSGHVDLTYDDDLRPATQSVNGTDSITFRYDLDGRLAGAGVDSVHHSAATGLIDSTALSGLSATSSQSYNQYGELQSLHYTTYAGSAFTQSLTRDSIGRIESLSETTPDSTRTYVYSYTTAGRLRVVKRGSNILEHYEYDTNGNRTYAERWLGTGKDTASAKYDAQDKMTRYRTGLYFYSHNGELAQRRVSTDTTRYTYDELGNLLKVKLPITTSTTVEYLIDGRNRRVGKKVNGAFNRGWLYQDGRRIVAELDSTGAVAIRYVYGSRDHVPDYMVRYGTTYRLITDQLGSIRMVVNASTGAVADSISYDAWGRVIAQKSPGFLSLGYAGGLYDHHTGLVRFGARDYDPAVGRWTCKDPIGFAGASTDLYQYAKGRPTSIIDPTGLRGEDDPFNFAPISEPYSELKRLRDHTRAKAERKFGDKVERYYINKWEHAEFSRLSACRYGTTFTLLVNTLKEYQDVLMDGQSWEDMINDLQSDQEGVSGEVPELPIVPRPFRPRGGH